MGIDVYLEFGDHYPVWNEEEDYDYTGEKKDKSYAGGAKDALWGVNGDPYDTGWYIRESYGGSSYGTKVLIPESWDESTLAIVNDETEAALSILQDKKFITIATLKKRVKEAARVHVGDMPDYRHKDTFYKFVENAERLVKMGKKVWIVNSY